MNQHSKIALYIIFPLLALVYLTAHFSSETKISENESTENITNAPARSTPSTWRIGNDLGDVTSEFDSGYAWAESQDVSSFDICDSTFGTGDSEDGCNEYVKENYSGYETFEGYECTEDCSGHEAGYQWAEDNEISDVDDCGGYSDSFIEGCEAYVDDNYY